MFQSPFNCNLQFIWYPSVKSWIGAVLLILSLSLNAAPQLTRNYAYRYFTSRDGLVQMQVQCAFQDKDGYLWFGTKGGVSRFDGNSFKNYSQNDGIPVGEMLAVGEWGYKKMFFYHYSFQFLHENDSLESVTIPDTVIFHRHDFQGIILNDNEILLVNLMNKKTIEAGQNIHRHLLWNKKNRKFTAFNGIDKKILAYNEQFIVTSDALYKRKGVSVQKMYSFPNKYLTARVDWESGLFYMYNQETYSIDKYVFVNNEFRFSSVVLKDMTHPNFALLPDKSIVYFTNHYEARIYPDQEAAFGMEIALYEGAFVDREGNLWIMSNNGLYNFFNLNFIEYTFGFAKPDNVWSILEDDDHNMWFGSFGFGLWRMDKRGNLKEFNTECKGWDHQYMGSIRNRAGVLYMPTGHGLTILDKGKFTNLPTGVSLSAYFDESNKEIYYSGLGEDKILQGLWIGAGDDRKFIPWSKGFPVALGKDSKGRIRVGSFFSTGYLAGDSIITDTTKRAYQGIVSFASDQWGRLWKGTTLGVFVEMPDGKEFRFAPQLKGMISSVYNYKNKYLLIGTSNGMAIALMSSDMIESPTIVEIGYERGFTGFDTGQNAFFEDHEGDVWVWTSANVLKFNPERLMHSQMNFNPKLRISGISFSINNNEWNSIPVADEEKISISSENKFFIFDFIANSISAPKQLIFKYRLVGLSTKWSDPVTVKTVSFTNIGYGKYTLEIKSSIDGIHWSDIVISPLIEITAPVYLRPKAIFVYFILLILLSILITRKLVKHNQMKKLKELNRMRLENELQLNTLRSKIIPHFTKNVLSAIGHFAMTDKLKAGHYISVFSKFTGLTLANADKNYITLSDEIEYLEKYLELEKMRFEDRFDFSIIIDKNTSMDLLLPTMTLHTYCDNAIRHGLVNKKGPGKLTVNIKNETSGVRMVISDNGVGRLKAKEFGTQGNGKGLKLIEAQINFYNQANEHKITQHITDLYDNEGNVEGTSVELFIPFGFKFEL